MARFKFGRKKRESDPDSSFASDAKEASPEYHLYLRRPSVLSRQQVESPQHSSENVTMEPPSDPSATTPWQRFKLYDSPFPRYRHAASLTTTDKNEVFLMGGLKEGSVFGDTWKVVPDVGPDNRIQGFSAQHVEVVNNSNPPARVGHASVLCGNAYIIYGGDTVDTDYNGYPDDNFYMFNVSNGKYTVPLHILGKPRGRYGHLIGVVSLSTTSSRLYLFGGQLENDVFNELYYFELTSFKLPKARWELVEPLNNFRPPPLTNHSMCIHKSKIYVFGGVYNNEKVSNDLWCFDTVVGKWLQLATSGDVPLPVNEHAAVIVGDRMYVYGGNDFAGIIYDSLHMLDLHSLKWARLSKDVSANGPGPRCGHSISYLPRLNQLLIMGGDKNDYVYLDPANLETYEDFDGQELGTMVYVLDVPTADHFLRGGVPRKVAASAGGAAGVLNRRAPSPLPSEDAAQRHRRSFSAGLDDFRTPNASIERFPRSLDPNKGVEVPQPVTPQEKFVEVDLPSSSAMSEREASPELEDMHYRYGGADASTPTGKDRETFTSESRDSLREGNGTPVLSNDYAHLAQPLGDGDERALRDNSGAVSKQAENGVGVINDSINGDQTVDNGSGAAGYSVNSGNAFSTGAGATPHIGTAGIGAAAASAGLALGASRNSDKANGSRIASQASSDAKVKKVISELNRELSDLRASTKLQMQSATEKIELLEEENRSLRTEADLASRDRLTLLQKQLDERDAIIGDLRASIDPNELDLDEPVESDTASSNRRGFTELTKYKLNRLEMSNRMVYLEDENSQLKERFARFEPFMNNQIDEISTLQKVIKGQEERIQILTAQVKLEAELHRQIADWRHKYENMEMEFQNFRLLHSEVEVSDNEEDDQDRDINADASLMTEGTHRKSTRQISTQLENLVLLWKSTTVADADTRLLNSEDKAVTSQLQKQIDELLLTSKQQYEGSSAEVQTLEAELQSKLMSLRTFEDNYRDALQSVNNTSKALNMTQDELQSQKIMIDKLVKENNELKLYKKASSVSKRTSTVVPSLDIAQPVGAPDAGDVEEGFTSAHYNMKLKDLEADLYILKQERDLLTDTVTTLKKDLYLARNGA